MGSKLIGFRVADDLAEEIETKAAEGSQSTSEYLRKLIDEDLYPGNGKQPSSQPKAELEELEETVGNLVDEHYNLSTQVEKLAKAHQEELDRVKREATNGHNELAGTIDKNVAEVQKILPLVQRGLDHLQTGLTGLKSELSPKVEGLKSDVARLKDRVATTERQVKRTPTGKIKDLPNKDGTKSSFWVYKGSAGLIKPFEFDSGEYVDLSEPIFGRGK